MPRVLSTRLLDTITIHGNTGAGFGSGHPIKQVKRDEYLVEINGLVGRIKLVAGDAGVPDVGEGYIEVLPYGVVSGEGATALVSTMVANGVDVVVGGTDYNVGDVVTVVGGTSTTPAELTITEVEGVISNTSITNGGSYFPDALPVITVSGDGVDAVVSIDEMEANAIGNEDAGTGYTVGDVVTVVGGTSTTPATIEITEVDGGIVVSATILEPGVYTELPANPVAVTGDGNDDATFNLAYGILSLSIDNAGTGYKQSNTSIDFDSGDAEANTVITGEVLTVDITEPGVYTELPANPVAVTGDGNDDATFNLTYSVSTIDVIDGGNDYDNARVVIDGNATAEVTIDSGEIDEITVISGGSGYTEIPDVTILACQDIEFAKVVLRNIVNTYDGNLYKWKFGVEATETGEATIL